MKKLIIIVIIILIIVALPSIPPLKAVLGNTDCSYSNHSGSFTFDEMNFKQRDFDMCLRKFEEFKKSDHVDTVLYRLCKKKYFQFWNYGSYLFEERFKLPYASWDEIKLRRGLLANKSGFQDF